MFVLLVCFGTSCCHCIYLVSSPIFVQSLKLQVIDDAVKTVVLDKTIFEEGKFAITASERGGLHELCIERTQHDLLIPEEANGEEDYEQLIVRMTQSSFDLLTSYFLMAARRLRPGNQSIPHGKQGYSTGCCVPMSTSLPRLDRKHEHHASDPEG